MGKLDVIKEVLAVVPDARAIILYGSRATGQHRDDSDYDIRAIVSPETIHDYDWAESQSMLDCSILEQYGWDEVNAPKIDLHITTLIDQTTPYKILWRL